MTCIITTSKMSLVVRDLYRSCHPQSPWILTTLFILLVRSYLLLINDVIEGQMKVPKVTFSFKHLESIKQQKILVIFPQSSNILPKLLINILPKLLIFTRDRVGVGPVHFEI